jgi:transcriptional regulator with XRE-family HTH domain
MITAEQIRAARAILRLEQVTLAEMSGLSVETIKRLERQSGTLQATQETVDRIKKALELAGIEFLDSSSEAGSGVRLVTAAILIDRIVVEFAAQLAAFIRPELEAIFKQYPQFLKRVQEPRVSKFLQHAIVDVMNRYLRIMNGHLRSDDRKATADLLKAALEQSPMDPLKAAAEAVEEWSSMLRRPEKK